MEKICGIYKLIFTGTTKVYIGQSNDIYRRYKEHIYNLVSNRASSKLQEAYKLFGVPELYVLSECSVKELEEQEQECIEIYNSINDGFNSIHITDRVVGLQGTYHGSCTHSKEDIVSILVHLVNNTEYSYKALAEKLKVSFNTVAQIASLKSHLWLKLEYPELYSKLVSMKGTRCKINSGITDSRSIMATTGKCKRVISPNNTVYEISNIRAFCREHNLHNGSFTEVLSGKRKSHKGWKICPEELV